MNDTSEHPASFYKDLNILSWNIHGNLKLKIDSPNFVNLINQNDIVFLNECWLSKNTKIELDGFTCYTKARKRKKRAKRDSGGLCVLIKDCISHLFKPIFWDHEDSLIFKLEQVKSSFDKDLYIIFYYMRPLSSTTRDNLFEDLDSYDLLFNKISELRKENELIIIGDLNSRCGTLCDFMENVCSNFDPLEEDMSVSPCISEDDLIKNDIPIIRKNEDLKLNDFGHRLINLCKVSGLLICNGRLRGDRESGKFTYIDKKGKSTNDYALISKGLLSKPIEFHVHDPNAYSDHCPIELKLLNLNLPYNANNLYASVENMDCNINSTNNIKPFISYNFNSDDDKNIFLNRSCDDYASSNLMSILDITQSEDFVFDSETIEACITGLNHVIEYAACPFTCNSRSNTASSSYLTENKKDFNNNSWYDTDCRNKKKEFDIARNLYKQTLLETDLRNFCNIRNAYRKLCRIKKSNFNAKYANDLLILSKSNSRLFWKKIKRKQKKKKPSCDFNSYFKNLFETSLSDLSDTGQTLINDNTTEDALHDDFLDAPFTLNDLDIALKKLKNNKSPGFDNVLNEFLKLNSPLFKITLLSVFNILFTNGYFPDAWSIGLIIPIHKKGNPDSAENYRGITLLSCVGKLFTSLINTRLNAWAETNYKFSKDQYRFRENKSTMDAMFILQNVVDIYLSNNNALFVSFIDLKKAFDCTNHQALWFKLEINKISTKIINIIKSMYGKMKLCVKNSLSSASLQPCVCSDKKQNRSCCLTCNSQILEPFFFYPHAGVFQGESLSPTLFSLFLNDINQYLQTDPNIGISIYQFYLALLLFADDMVLFSHNRFGLQAGLVKLNEYCNNCGLIVNVEKTK